MQQLRFDFPASRRKPTLEEFLDEGIYDESRIPEKYLDKVQAGDWRRAGGGVVCDRCGLQYYDHPNVPFAALTILCNGDLVHL